MTLPRDVWRCPGRILDEKCSRRDVCARFTDPAHPNQVWSFPAALGWLCPSFLAAREDAPEVS